MEFKIKKNDFLDPLKKINRIITKNVVFPILENIIIKINEKVLKLTSSNLDIELNAYIKKKLFILYNPGRIIVSGKKILNICRNISNNEELYFRVINKQIYIKVKKSLFKINLIKNTKFPIFKKFCSIKKFSISQKILKEMILSVYFSIANNDIRTSLNGILIEYQDNFLYGVTTDGHRLSMYKTPLQLNITYFNIIVSKKSILEIHKLLELSKNKDIQIKIKKNYASFKLHNILLTTKLLHGNFPNYKDVILSQSTHRILVPREKLRESLLKISVLCNTTFKGVYLEFSKNQLTIKSKNQEDEESSDSFYINNKYEKISFFINVFYLLDVLNALNINLINFIFNIPISCIQIQSEMKKEILYIIMPLKL
ncbi:DNA polymerase III subunit beta [Buchnera aphidicola]|uniref:Beta sliding clamp n=1 Tax=Buchnera aphidicola (Cinara strobi) TaxID=1921549 RepID=A0A3B1E9A1_9GAMM|nr:DNA polymerase III subunit beta [Buchnera aphidicola]VAX76189.1 Beta sliding clamp [Buchnera aphidicola (Cinara strobi)]